LVVFLDLLECPLAECVEHRGIQPEYAYRNVRAQFGVKVCHLLLTYPDSALRGSHDFNISTACSLRRLPSLSSPGAYEGCQRSATSPVALDSPLSHLQARRLC
jgi:hypothetical protein